MDLERVSFCGLSLGGMVGMALARDAPERVDRLVLCCTAAYLGPPEGWHERARIVRAERNRRDRRARCSSAGSRSGSARSRPRWSRASARCSSPSPREGYAACCEAIAGWDARTGLDAIRAPTLVIAGADDVATPPEDGAFLAESIPGAELVVLPGAAHLANVEQPERFDRALLAFLSGTTSTEEAA